jgi:large subunit ribosomal protein L3
MIMFLFIFNIVIGILSKFINVCDIPSLVANFETIPITILKINKNIIIDKSFCIERNKYVLKLGYGEIKDKNINKSLLGYFNKVNVSPKRYVKEFIVDKSVYDNSNIGSEINIDTITTYNYLKVSGKTIGKGFAGVMKRHNFSGLRATHGVSVSHRSHGSTGQRQDPGKVFKGKKMAGHMGNKIRTMQNLEIIKSDIDNDLLFVKGSIPGSKNCEVLVKKAVKNIKKLTVSEKIEVI